MVICFDGVGLHIHCDPGYPDAWRHKTYRPQIQQWAIAARERRAYVHVSMGKDSVLVLPDGEFPLDKDIGEDDQFELEFSGSQLVAVRVIKSGEPPQLPRQIEESASRFTESS